MSSTFNGSSAVQHGKQHADVICFNYSMEYGWISTTFTCTCILDSYWNVTVGTTKCMLYLQYPRCVRSGQGRLRPPGPLWGGTVHTSHNGCGQ